MSEYIAALERENDTLRDLLSQAYVNLRCSGGMSKEWFDKAAKILQEPTCESLCVINDPFVGR